MHGDAEGAAKAFTQAGVDAAEAAKGMLKKYIPIAGIAVTGADILTNSYRDIQTISGWRERSQQAREAGENSQPHNNLHGFTGGIRNFLNNREHILSTQNPNQNALKGRPADNSKEQIFSGNLNVTAFYIIPSSPVKRILQNKFSMPFPSITPFITGVIMLGGFFYYMNYPA